MNASVVNLMSLAHTAAEVRRRDLEVMANSSAFPRFLWSEMTNRNIAFAKAQIRDAYRQIGAAAKAERMDAYHDETVAPLADAIVDFVTHAAGNCDRYIELANTMDALAIRHPIRALIIHFRGIRAIHQEETIMDDAARRIKLCWPSPLAY